MEEAKKQKPTLIVLPEPCGANPYEGAAEAIGHTNTPKFLEFLAWRGRHAACVKMLRTVIGWSNIFREFPGPGHVEFVEPTPEKETMFVLKIEVPTRGGDIASCTFSCTGRALLVDPDGVCRSVEYEVGSWKEGLESFVRILVSMEEEDIKQAQRRVGNILSVKIISKDELRAKDLEDDEAQ